MITGVGLTQAADGTPVYVNPLAEPAAWALAILGLGVLGGIARRRRARTPVLAG